MNSHMSDFKTRRRCGRRRYPATVVLFFSLLSLAVLSISAAGCGEEALTPNTSAEAGKLQLDETNFDFGTVPVGQKVEHDFIVTNAGNGTLKMGELDVKLLDGC